jgi:putative protease
VVGEVTHYFPHVSAGVIKLSKDLKAGEMVQIKGHTTDFKQAVDSLQVDHVPVGEARKGQEIGLKVKDRVRIGDTVYRL